MLANPAVKVQYAQKDEFALFDELVNARANAGLTQADVAERMGTQVPAISRLESGAQVLDLEELAKHRGSLIGAIPGIEQPSQKYFDSLVFSTFRKIIPFRGSSQSIPAISCRSNIAHKSL